MAAQLVSTSTLQVASAALRSPFAMICSLAAVAARRRGRTGACWGLGTRSGGTRQVDFEVETQNQTSGCPPIGCQGAILDLKTGQNRSKRSKVDTQTNLLCPGAVLHVCRTNVAKIC